MLPKIRTLSDLEALFPKNPEDLNKIAQNAINKAKINLEEIYDITADKRTFDNTAKKLDGATAQFLITLITAKTLEIVSPDNNLRASAHKIAIELNNFFIDNFLHNQKLYKAIEVISIHQKSLSETQKYYIDQTLLYYKKSGLNLPPEQQARIKEIMKSLGLHEMNFESNIASSNKTLHATKEQLSGLSENFINSLQRTADGAYILGLDYPTYFYVIENCSNATIRKAIWKEFVNRAYPVNKKELSDVINLRDELAHILGYESYAALNIADEMACSVGVVEGFLFNLLDQSAPKIEQEFTTLKKELPQGVKLSAFDKFFPWDLAYTKAIYKKKYFAMDEEEISQYFPFDHVIKELFELYQEFFGLEFKKTDNITLWNDDLLTYTVFNKSNEFLGYLILDLFPRPNKFSHAAQETIVPGITIDNKINPGVVLVLANFPPKTTTQPSLLTRNDVITFFHEFGHAIHALLGTTELASQSGTNVKRDFVEMPSQMLEEWMWQPQILKRVSKHWQTGKQLSDSTIDNIIKLKNFDSGDWIQRQCYLSLLALQYYMPGSNKDIDGIQKELFRSIRSEVEFENDDHFYASFGHLMGYGAQYYSYLWSKVFAIDLFSFIQKSGLTYETGKKYIDNILSKGGSADPAQLIRKFLSRDANADAFINDLGL